MHMVNLAGVFLVNNHRSHILVRRQLNNSRVALQAVTAARRTGDRPAATADVAAACTGSTSAYVRAGAIVLKSETDRFSTKGSGRF